MDAYREIVNRQRKLFRSGKTRDVKYRMEMLGRLKSAILAYEEKITDALYMDLNKDAFDSYTTEIGFVLEEISYAMRKLPKWAKRKRVRTDISSFPAKSLIQPEPYGVTLIISPWNYPFQLAITPLVGSIAAGNCAVIKPSSYSPNTSRVLKELIEETFDEEYICVIEGGRDANRALLDTKFDYIFFTYTRIINEKHFNRLLGLIKDENVIFGGEFDAGRLKINPCFIDDAAWNSPVMQEEIFGPILPIIEFEDLNEIIDKIIERPKPLALYYFTTNKKREEKILKCISFGGGCINDTIMHLVSKQMPFGGVGESGMGSYHGKKSFDTFTHYKSILRKSNLFDVPLRYPTHKNLKIVKRIMK